MNNKLLAILLITLSPSAFALTEQTAWGVYSESDVINDALYSRSETCEYQADKEIRRALPNISAMCATTQAPMNCEVSAIEIIKEEFIKACEAAK
jgi:hypothetical protein